MFELYLSTLSYKVKANSFNRKKEESVFYLAHENLATETLSLKDSNQL